MAQEKQFENKVKSYLKEQALKAKKPLPEHGRQVPMS